MRSDRGREPLAWLLPAMAIAVVLGIVVADGLDLGPVVPRGAGACCIGGAWWFRRSPRLVASCACMLAACVGAEAIGVRLAVAGDARPVARFDAAVEARVCAHRVHSTHVFVELCEVTPVGLGGRAPAAAVPSRAQLVASTTAPDGDWLASLEADERLRAWIRFDAIPSARNPGAADRRRRAARRGLAARAVLIDPALAVRLPSDRSPWLRRFVAGRRAVAKRLVDRGDGGGLLAALALGDRRGLGSADRDAFRRLGLSHLLAVSGLHLVLVGAMVFVASRALLLRVGSLAARADLRAWAAGLAVALALGYALLTGWGVPARRAWLFLSIASAAVAARRSPAPLHALAAALCWVAVLEPAAVFELGPQLSFAATAALVVAAGDSQPAALASRLQAWWVGGLRVSATAIVATAPVLAAHGLSGTPVGLAANALAVPATGFVLLPVSLAAAGVAALGESGGLVDEAAWIAEVALTAARAAATRVPAPVDVVPATAAVVVAAAVAVLALRVRGTGLRVALCLAVCAGLAAAPAARVGPDPPRIVAFAVGQGDAILVEGTDAAMLVDAGWAYGDVDLGRSIVVPGLRALGVEHLDVVVASHADADHRGGLRAVIEAFEIGEIWVPRGAADDFAELAGLAHRRGIAFRERGAEDRAWQRGDLTLEPLWPPTARRETASRNDASLVVRATVAGTRVLLTGDISEVAERGLLASGAGLRAEILKVPHHGSRSSSSRPLLEATAFDLALLSAPCGGGRGLPSAAALARLEAAGSVWWTGRDGALVVEIPASGGGSPERGDLATSAYGWRMDSDCGTP